MRPLPLQTTEKEPFCAILRIMKIRWESCANIYQ